MNPKYFITFFTLIFVSCVTYAQNSYIQVAAEPGISVFLDGQFKGKTTPDVGGMIIEKLSAGIYTIKVVKEGFTPQEDRISIKAGEVFMYTVKPFSPKIRIRQQGNEYQQNLEYKTGKLKIQSIPVGIRIEVPSVDINSLKKQDEWYVEDIPIGNYSINFYLDSKVLRGTIIILENKQTEIFVNFLNRTVDFSGETANEHEKSLIEWVYDDQGLAERGGSGISYELGGRGYQSLPLPEYDNQGEGRVVVEVSVDRSGKVIQAVPGIKGSNTLDEYLLRVAREAALKAKFEVKKDAPIIQKGTITYNFILR